MHKSPAIGRLSILITCLLINACAVGPDFKKPDAPISENWLDRNNRNLNVDQKVDYSDWWTIFNDPVLTELVEKAYKQNLNLHIAGLRILETRAQLGIARGQQYPQTQEFTGGAIYNQLSQNAANGAGADRRFWDFNLGFDAAWELDLWGRFRRGAESAQANLGASITNYDDILVSLTAEIARVYINLRTFQERLAIAETNVKTQSRSFDITDIRFRNGAVTELDPMQALTLLRNTEATIPALETAIKQTLYALSTLLGIPPSNLEQLLKGAKKIPVAPETVSLGIPADLLLRRPDVRLSELQAAAQSAKIGVAKSELFPRFILLGSVGMRASDNGSFLSNGAHLGDIFSGSSFTWFVGPSVNWSILNYGRIRNDVRVQDARFQQLIVNYQNTVLTAAREVEDGAAAFLGAQGEVKYLKESVQAAKRAVELAEIQYREGAVDYTRILNTQETLLRQQDSLIDRKGRINTSLISVYKALGGGWQQRLGKAFVPANIQKEMRERVGWGDFLSEDLPDDKTEPPAPASEQPLFPFIGF
ncbi:MAG: efflux transporter outer membrane subunit [Methylococcales bacterium]|nr:efflux transporter outer membrane subunit [Methylococcales bacterium]